jgi:methylated-DNA-[protein]-cysteine S-methyltransferase
MALTEGSCRLGLWHVRVVWNGNIIHQVRFQRTGNSGPVPDQIPRYLRGKISTLDPLKSSLAEREGIYGQIYRAIQLIPYGSVRTYGYIAQHIGTHPRVVGQAMKRNTTPIIIPCHRVVAAGGIGGFSPDIWIKEELLRIEAHGLKKMQKSRSSLSE